MVGALYLYYQHAAIAEIMHLIKNCRWHTGRADRVADILIRNLFSCMNRHAQ